LPALPFAACVIVMGPQAAIPGTKGERHAGINRSVLSFYRRAAITSKEG
jgi:hypothetical protein